MYKPPHALLLAVVPVHEYMSQPSSFIQLWNIRGEPLQVWVHVRHRARDDRGKVLAGGKALIIGVL